MKEKKDFLEAGKIVGLYGVSGQVKVQPWADKPEVLLSYRKFFIDGNEYIVQSGFVNAKAQVILKFSGVDTTESAEGLKNKVMMIARSDINKIPGHVLIADMIGMQVVSADGEKVGILEDILPKPASDILLVRAENGKEILIPCISEFIKSIDEKQCCITVKLLEGMI